MNNRKTLLELVAQNHQHIFVEKVDTGGKKIYPGNTHENCARLLYDFCDAASRQFPLEKFGLLTKNSGENGYTWPSGKRTSHDSIAIPNGERADLIGSAGDINHRPTLEWQPKPPNEWREHNVWIEHTKVVGQVIEPPPTNPKKDYERDFGGDARGIKFAEMLFEDYRVNNVPPNPGMGVWFWRVFFVVFHEGETLQSAVDRYRPEWISLLGGKKGSKEL